MVTIILKLLITIWRQYERKKIPPIHPGEILLEEFLNPMNLSQNKIALDMRVPARCINQSVFGKRRINFNMSPEFWLGLKMENLTFN